MADNKEIYIDFIVDELNKSNVQYKDVVSLFCAKFRTTDRTFDKYWKLANDAYSKQREAINAAKISTTIETEIQDVRYNVLTKNDALSLLSDIAINAKDTDRIRAIEVVAKLEGWNSAEKIDLKQVNPETWLQRFKKKDVQ
jgi:hypothetical protein